MSLMSTWRTFCRTFSLARSDKPCRMKHSLNWSACFPIRSPCFHRWVTMPTAGYGPRRFKSETYIVGLSSEDDEDEGEGTSYAKVEDDDALSWPQKTIWLFFSIGSVTSVVVTIWYWSAIYPAGVEIDGLNVNQHILGAVFMLIEVIMSNIPIRLLHFIYAHVFSSIYVLFTVIYWAAGGENGEGQRYIYKVIDYEDHAGEAIFTIFLVLIVLQSLVHLFLFMLFRFRAWLVSKCQ